MNELVQKIYKIFPFTKILLRQIDDVNKVHFIDIEFYLKGNLKKFSRFYTDEDAKDKQFLVFFFEQICADLSREVYEGELNDLDNE